MKLCNAKWKQLQKADFTGSLGEEESVASRSTTCHPPGRALPPTQSIDWLVVEEELGMFLTGRASKYASK